MSALAIAAIAAGSAQPTRASVPANTLYASGGPSGIATVDQEDGSITLLGGPAPQPAYIEGLAFDSAGRLFASGCTPFPGCNPLFESTLVELDAQTGAILGVIGSVIDDSGFRPAIQTLSVQPRTDVLYGFSGGQAQVDGNAMGRIDRSTATATLITPLGWCRPDVPILASCGTAYGFAPDGTLYHTGMIFFPSPLAWLVSLDPITGAPGAGAEIEAPQGGALAVRGDGTIFASVSFRRERPRDGPPQPPVGLLSILDPLTGTTTLVAEREGGFGLDLDFSPLVVQAVAIDIKPGNDQNRINPMSRGVIPVAILGSDGFDVADVDVTTLAFGPAAAPLAHRNGPHVKDADHDGLVDLLAHFRTEESGIAFGDTEACVTGEVLDGAPFEGCDSIRTAPTCGLGFELALLLPG